MRQTLKQGFGVLFASKPSNRGSCKNDNQGWSEGPSKNESAVSSEGHFFLTYTKPPHEGTYVISRGELNIDFLTHNVALNSSPPIFIVQYASFEIAIQALANLDSIAAVTFVSFFKIK